MILTKKQKKLQRELTELILTMQLDIDVSSVDQQYRTTRLELAKRQLIVNAVVGQYLLIDEMLSNEICRDFFPRRSFIELWKKKYLSHLIII